MILSPRKLKNMLNVLYRTCRDINDKRNINNFEQVQRRATRFILGRDYSEYERLSKLNLLILNYRREIDDLFFLVSYEYSL